MTRYFVSELSKITKGKAVIDAKINMQKAGTGRPVVSKNVYHWPSALRSKKPPEWAAFLLHFGVLLLQ